jgi:hypothetical protein
VLITSLNAEILTLAQWYRDRAVQHFFCKSR